MTETTTEPTTAPESAPQTAPEPQQGNIVSERDYRYPSPSELPDDLDTPKTTGLPALPPLPRPLELRASESWARQVKEVGGPLAESDGAIAAALAAQATMAEGLEALEAARQTRDPRKTAADHLRDVRSGFERLLSEGARKRDAAMAALNARERALQEEVDTRTALSPSADVADIRAALQRMAPEKRSAVLNTALETEDTAVLAAVFSGREMTTGINDVTRRSLKRRFEERKYPGIHGLRTGIEKARELAEKAFDELMSLDGAVLGSSKAIEEFNLQVQAADQAWFNLNRKLSGGAE